MVDWRHLKEHWPELPQDLKDRLKDRFRGMNLYRREELAQLIEREPYAKDVFELAVGFAWTPPPPPPRVAPPLAPHEWLWDKFSAILRVSDLDPNAYRSEFETEWGVVRDLDRESQQRTIEMLAKRILKEAVPAAPPAPPVAPPPRVPAVAVPPVPVRVHVEEVRVSDIVTRYSVLSGRPFIIDLDLVRRVKETGVTLRARGEVSYRKPFLGFPELFYQITPDERMERFGYMDIYDALAYQLFEGQSSRFKRITLTRDDLRMLGFTPEDMAEIDRRLEERRRRGRFT